MAQSQIVANGTADSTGAVTITFPTVNVNTEFTGNVSVPLSPNTAQWIVEVTGTPVSSLGGSSSYGPIQISNTDVLSLTGTGLVAGTQYQAVLIGILVYGTSPAVVPVPTTSAVDAALARIGSALDGTDPGAEIPALRERYHRVDDATRDTPAWAGVVIHLDELVNAVDTAAELAARRDTAEPD